MSTKFSKKKKEQVLKKYHGQCAYCGIVLDTRPKEWGEWGLDQFTIDHINPNGGNDLSNLNPCCRSCNSRKGTGSIERLKFNMFLNKWSVTRFTQDQIDFILYFTDFDLMDYAQKNITLYYEEVGK